MCTRIIVWVFEQQQASLPHWQFTVSDGRQVTRMPAVVLIVNVSRPGDMSCDTGWRSPGHGTLYQTSSQQRQTSHHSTLRWRLICSLRTFWHWQHTWYFWHCNVFILHLRLHHVNLIVWRCCFVYAVAVQCSFLIQRSWSNTLQCSPEACHSLIKASLAYKILMSSCITCCFDEVATVECVGLQILQWSTDTHQRGFNLLAISRLGWL